MTDDRMFKHDPDQPAMQGWHLDKRVSVSHIFATLSFAFGLGSFMWALDARVTAVKAELEQYKAVTDIEIKSIKHFDDQTIMEINRHYVDVKTMLIRIEDKIDRQDEKINRHIETGNHGTRN